MRVLIVEDDATTADYLTALLTMEGHQTRFEGNGLAALTYLAAPSQPLPDVIITDLKMPGMGGEEFLERVSQHPLWSAIPVIVATATSLDEQAHLKQRWPKLCILGKPFEADVLLDALKRLDA